MLKHCPPTTELVINDSQVLVGKCDDKKSAQVIVLSFDQVAREWDDAGRAVAPFPAW